MRRIQIDFSLRPYSRLRIVGVAMFMLAMGALVAQAWIYFSLRAEVDTWQADRRRLDRMASVPRSQDSPEDRERLHAELRLANRIIDKLDTPWDALFRTVESTGDQAILLGVEPDAEQRQVRLSVEAKDAIAMLDYLRELRRAPALKNVYLTGHQINLQDPQRPVRFTVDAHWVEPQVPKEGVENATNAQPGATPASERPGAILLPSGSKS